MKFNFTRLAKASIFSLLMLSAIFTNAQTLEWQLSNLSYSSIDPDGAGPATGSFTFELQIRSTGATATGINAISTGWSYDSTKAMLPTGVACVSLGTPTNVVLTPELITASFTYGSVNQCGTFTQTAGSASLNKRVIGTLDGTGIDISSAWKTLFTVTMWSTGTSIPEGGFLAINSGAGGSPAEFPTYAASDAAANEYAVNSLTYSTPLAAGTSLPVTFSGFNVSCRGNGTLISWATESELNSSYFVVEKSLNGRDWSSIGKINAAGNSQSRKSYQYFHPQTGKALFRVKEYDLDGKTTLTAIASANCESGIANTTIFPNPAKDIVKVSINSQTGERVQLQITDVEGRKLRNKSASLIAGSNQVELNLSGLADGNYLLQVIRSQTISESIPFIKN